jgi:hypothetical protein
LPVTIELATSQITTTRKTTTIAMVMGEGEGEREREREVWIARDKGI